METKYTKDGKKVAVLGKLNNEEWIVQEIFVSGDQEIPAGENFTAKGLLDKPLETWHTQQAIRLQKEAEQLKLEINTARDKLDNIRKKIKVKSLIQQITERYQNCDITELDTLFAFMAGEITHLILANYSNYEIVTLEEALEEALEDQDQGRFDGLKLITLFGCTEYGQRYNNNITNSLQFRINNYRDGSGPNRQIYPCRSHEEAVKLLDQLIADSEATEKLIQQKKKYGLVNPTPDKIKTHYDKLVQINTDQIQKTQAQLEEKKQQLETLKEKRQQQK